MARDCWREEKREDMLMDREMDRQEGGKVHTGGNNRGGSNGMKVTAT